MERQKRKLKGIADLYNIEDERQRRQPSQEEDDVPRQDISQPDISNQTTLTAASGHQNIFQQDTSQQNILNPQENITLSPPQASLEESSARPKPDIPRQDTSRQDIPTQNITSPGIWSPDIVDSARGYFPVFNDVTDRLIRELKLDVYEQAVLLKMYRDSRGWKSDECEISHAEIVRSCNMSKSQSQRTLAKLTARGLVVNLGRAKSGPERNRFKVLPGVPVIPSRNIFREDISPEGQYVSSENTVPGQDISLVNTNKNNNKDSLNTHTQTGVGVGSKFSLEDCKRFAEHLQKTSQGINNPGGYATTIFRSGEADAQIEVFLNPPAPLESGSCPDCGGSGYYYPEGIEKGVKICKHEKLKGAGQK